MYSKFDPTMLDGYGVKQSKCLYPHGFDKIPSSTNNSCLEGAAELKIGASSRNLSSIDNLY